MENFKTWKEFLSGHPDKNAYDQQAESIQSLVNPEEKSVNNFRLLSENKTLVCMTKSLLKNHVQLTFFHSIRKLAILSSEAEFFGLMGFNNRASAARLDPDIMIRQSRKEQKVPSFEEIMALTDEKAITDLAPHATMIEEKLDSHALLPPSIYLALVDLEDMRAPSVLLTVI